MPQSLATNVPDVGAVAVRERIRQVAHDHYLAHGFSRTTMDELAGELGMSKKTLYQHFRRKTELLDAVLDLRLATIRRELDAASAAPDAGFAGRMQLTLEVLQRRLAEVKPPFMQDLRRHAPDAFRRIERFRHQYVGQVFGRLLQQGRGEGLVRSDLDDRIVIEAVLTLVQSTVTPDTALRLGISLADAFGTVLRLVLGGVLTEQGRGRLQPAVVGGSERGRTEGLP